MIAVSILAFAVGVTLILWFGYRFAARLTGEVVTKRFEDAESILNNHRAPARWLVPPGPVRRVLRRMEHLRYRKSAALAGVPAVSDDKGEVRLRRRVLSRFDELIAYFQVSPFFEDPEAKETLLAELRSERATWESRALKEIVGQDDDAGTGSAV